MILLHIAPDDVYFSTKKYLTCICCWYSLEVPHWRASNVYTQHVSWRNIMRWLGIKPQLNQELWFCSYLVTGFRFEPHLTNQFLNEMLFLFFIPKLLMQIIHLFIFYNKNSFSREMCEILVWAVVTAFCLALYNQVFFFLWYSVHFCSIGINLQPIYVKWSVLPQVLYWT